MAELLAGILAVVLEYADVLDAWVAFEIEYPLGCQTQEMLDFLIARVPQVPVVIRIFYEHLVGTDRVHTVVETIAATAGFTFDVIQRFGMNHRTSRPGRAGIVGRLGDHLQPRG